MPLFRLSIALLATSVAATQGCADGDGEVGCPWESAGAEGALYLRGATVAIGGEGALHREEGLVVLVHEGEILCVEPEPEAPPPGAEVLDLDGMTLLPGFVDAHVHIALHEEDLTEPMGLFLDHGVTTVRDLGSSLDRILDLREEVAQGRMEGPRIVTAGPLLTAPGGHPVATLWPGDEELIESAGRQLDDADAARAEVRALAEAGVDLIKCVLTTCAQSSLGPCERLDSAVFSAIVDEARSLGLYVAVHTNSDEDVAEAVDNGVASIEHGRTDAALSAELAEQIAAEGITYVPTVAVSLQSSRVEEQWFYDSLAMLRVASAPLAVGTDAANPGIVWGEAYLSELEHIVVGGYEPREVLYAATRAGAELLGIADEVGTIAVGLSADLVAVEGDPLEDISAAGDVRLVIARGEIVRNHLVAP